MDMVFPVPRPGRVTTTEAESGRLHFFPFLSYREREPLASLFLEQNTLKKKIVLMAFENRDESLYRESHNVTWKEKKMNLGLSKCLSPPEIVLDSALFVLRLFLQSQDIFSAGRQHTRPRQQGNHLTNDST